MITKQQSAKLRKLIVAYTNAIGVADVEGEPRHHVLHRANEQDKAHRKLHSYIRTLTEGQ